jgi:hypothetical protein
LPLTGFNYARYENEGKLIYKAALSGNKLAHMRKILDKRIRVAHRIAT